MLSDKRLSIAVTASVLLNVGCVAVVGEAARERQPPHVPRSTASLHPAVLQMAASRQEENGGNESGQPGDGSADASGSSHKPGSGQSSDDDSDTTQANSNRARPSANRTDTEYKMRYRLNKSEVAAMNTADRLEKHLNSGQPLSASQAQTLGRVEQQLFHTAVQALTTQRALPGQNPLQSASSSRMNLVTHPSVPSRNSHAGAPGNSMSPRLVTYPKMKLDLGTIHMTRPKHGVTGGGRSDMRDVEITAHYVVDDPNNVPKTLPSNRLLKLFAANCNGDPGNTSHCLPTGGNTSLGGGTLHGKHDHITGVKYCIPGGGGIPGGGSAGSQSQSAQAAQSQQGRNASGKNANGQNAGQSGQGKASGPLAGPQQIISQGYQGHGSAFSTLMNGWHEGHLNPNETVAATIKPLHLPGRHGDFHGMVPGAEVPLEDQRWVTDPQAHLAAAPLGAQTFPLPHFTVSPHSIGSMSKFGTINWGRPVKIQHKKQPPGGDGSGLLGMYYRGTNFNQLVLSRPDRNIDYDWSAGPPDPRFSRSEEYSVRWEGKLVPKTTDTYTLMTGSDDGVRLYLDDRLLISNWTVHSPSEDTAKVSLIAGHAYKIKVEYYENGYGYAAIRLYWESPRVPREYIPEQCLRYPRSDTVR